MKLKFGMIVTSGKGSMGGQTIQRGGSGVIGRNKPIPPNLSPFSKHTISGKTRTSAKAYTALTPLEQATWKLEAANYPRTDTLGDRYHMTAQQLFISLNNNLQNIGVGIISVPASKTVWPLAGIFSVSITAAGTSFIVNYSPNAPNGAATLLFYCSASVSNGISSIGSRLKQLAVLINATGQNNDDITLPYSGQFQTPRVGQRVFVKIVAIDNASGAATDWGTTYGIVS